MIEKIKGVLREFFLRKSARLVAKVNNDPGLEKELSLSDIFLYFSIYSGLVVNLFFGGLKLGMGIAYGSSWFVTVGIYFVLLGGMRFMLLIRERRGARWRDNKFFRRYQVRTYLYCGIMLLILNLALILFGVPMIYDNPAVNYPTILMDGFVFYAVYSFIGAIVQLVRGYRIREPMIAAAKRISLVTALVSVFSLQSAILAKVNHLGQFDPAMRLSEFVQILLNSLTGSMVAFIVQVIAISMIVQALWTLHKGRYSKRI